MDHALTYTLLTLVLLLSLVLVAVWRTALSRIGQLRLERDAANQALTQVGAVADQLADQARLQERRASEFFGIIEGVEKERDNWQRLYRESSQAAGVAQAWLARDLGRVVQIANVLADRLRSKGETVPKITVDPQLTQVVDEFAEKHGNPRPEVTGTSGLALAEAVDKATSGERLQG